MPPQSDLEFVHLWKLEDSNFFFPWVCWRECPKQVTVTPVPEFPVVSLRTIKTIPHLLGKWGIYVLSRKWRRPFKQTLYTGVTWIIFAVLEVLVGGLGNKNDTWLLTEDFHWCSLALGCVPSPFSWWKERSPSLRFLK